jgi:asparagine synthase (glutamine-hydrolysing)
MADFIRPTDFEVATCAVLGLLPPEPMPVAPSARNAIDDAIRPALVDGPCFVTFSGGRDSSAVLAAATDLARREGLPLPIPATKVYPDHPESDESEWQRMVIDHLGLTEWLRVEFRDEHELLGSAAKQSLLLRGLMWPPALQVQSHWYEILGAGSVLTGEGGDEVLASRRITPVRVLPRRRRPTMANTRRAVRSILPAPMREAAIVRQWSQIPQPWLRPEVRRRALELLAGEMAAQPLRYDKATWWIARRRAWTVYQHNHARVAADHGITAIDPLLDRGFLAALARLGGRLGFTGRTATMVALFADLLPSEVLRRRSKAAFNGAHAGASLKAFAEDWDGSGVDPDLVDIGNLRREWLSDRPSPTTALLLQNAWLHTKRDGEVGLR